MFILMCGMPSCGKSAAIDIIAESDDATPLWVIRPEEWLPDNITELSPQEDKEQRIGCWQKAMDAAEKAVEEHDPSEVIVLDCTNSKYRPLESLLRRAKRNKHKLVIMYVNSGVAQCEARAGDSWIGPEIAKIYIRNIRDSLPKFKSKCDRIVIIANNDSLDILEENVLAAWSKLCPIT